MSTVFQYVKMTGQPLVGTEIDSIVAQTLISQASAEKVANALVSKLSTNNIETKHKAAVALIACMERGHGTFRQCVAAKSQIVDSALKPPSKFDDENDKSVMKVVVELGRQIMNLMFEKQERRDPPPQIYDKPPPLPTHDIYSEEVKQAGASRHVEGIGNKASSSLKSHTDTKFTITKDAAIAAQTDSLQNSYNSGIETAHLQPRRGGGFFSDGGSSGKGAAMKSDSESGGLGQGVQGSIPPTALFTPGTGTTVVSGSLFSSSSNVLSGISGGGYRTSGPAPEQRVVKPPPVIRNDGALENKLIDDVCVPSGIGVQPSKQLLSEFVEKVRTLDIDCVVGGLVTKTGDESLVARSKAFWVIGTLIFDSPSLLQAKPVLPTLFSEHVATLSQNAAVLNNAQARSKATQVLTRLQEIQQGQAGGQTSSSGSLGYSTAPAFSSTPAVLPANTAPTAPSGPADDIFGLSSTSSSTIPQSSAANDIFTMFSNPAPTPNTTDLFGNPSPFASSAPSPFSSTPTPNPIPSYQQYPSVTYGTSSPVSASPPYNPNPAAAFQSYNPNPAASYQPYNPNPAAAFQSYNSNPSAAFQSYNPNAYNAFPPQQSITGGSGINLVQRNNDHFDFMGGKNDTFDFVNDMIKK